MNKKPAILFCCLLMFSYAAMSFAEEAPQNVVDLANGKLADMGRESAIVDAVKAENAKGKTLDQIKSLDEKWQTTPGLSDEMKAIMENDCARFLRKLQNSNAYYAEIFVMDNQGANVAMTDKTTDYWQGDEAKFKKSFNNGTGAVFVDEVKFDGSAQAYLSQVSVPVMDGDKAIGSITFGIDVDKVK